MKELTHMQIGELVQAALDAATASSRMSWALRPGISLRSSGAATPRTCSRASSSPEFNELAEQEKQPCTAITPIA